MGFEINAVTISGNLTRDPELRSTAGGTSVCSLRIAHNERVKNGQTGEWESRPNFFDVTVWSGQGEWVARNLSKGAKVVVKGRLKWREWQDQQGNKRQSVDINCDDLIPVGQRDGDGGSNGGGGSTREDVPADTSGFTSGGGSGYGQGALAGAPGPGADDDIPF